MTAREMLERMARVAEATEDHTMWKIQAAICIATEALEGK